jgi:hypothetical protein
VFSVGNEADAGPAFGFHLVEVLEAGEVSGGIGSSGFGGLLADGVGDPYVVDASDLHGLSALLGSGEEGQDGENGKHDSTLHGDF